MPFKEAGAGPVIQAAANAAQPAASHADTASVEADFEKENDAPIPARMPVFKKPKLFQAPAAVAGAQHQNGQAAPQQHAIAAADTAAGDAMTFAVLYTKRAKFSVGGADGIEDALGTCTLYNMAELKHVPHVDM